MNTGRVVVQVTDPWLNQEFIITLLVRAAVEVLQLGMQIGESWRQVHAKPVQDGKVGHVDAVHVARDRGRPDVGRVVVAVCVDAMEVASTR